LVIASIALASCAFAQISSSTTTTDINGNRITGGTRSSTDGVTTDLRQSINGREVPLEQVEEKILSKSATSVTRERIVRHYGADGKLVLTERVLSEETQTPSGDSTVKSTTYRSDLSGNMMEAEHKTVDTHKNGAATQTDTSVEKRSVNGIFQVAERRSATSEPTTDGKRESETVYLPSTSGSLYEAQRTATVEKKVGNQIERNTAVYEPGVNGNLSLTRQEVDKTIANPDGSSTSEKEIFGRASDGRAYQADAGPRLTEKRTIERQKRSDGAIVEVQRIQIPSVNDPSRLDPPRKVDETVCRGTCDKKP
jgi:hypothetical protein